jgi:hypothetical protein
MTVPAPYVACVRIKPCQSPPRAAFHLAFVVCALSLVSELEASVLGVPDVAARSCYGPNRVRGRAAGGNIHGRGARGLGLRLGDVLRRPPGRKRRRRIGMDRLRPACHECQHAGQHRQ